MVKPSRYVAELEPYRITPQDVWSESAPEDLLKLDWNESPEDFGWFRDAVHEAVDRRGMIAWYPDYLAIQLTDALASFVGISSNNILTFPGSDVGLETLCRAYLEPGDVVVVLTPTYENFFVYALQTGARIDKLDVPKPFEVDAVAIESRIAAAGPAKAVYLVRPNNPCGYVIAGETIERLARRFPDTMIIVDEAYIEFAEVPSTISLIRTYPNMVIARTFSKGFGMAGLRLGYLCASLDVINTVNKIRNGKNISMLAQALGLHALRNIGRIQEWIGEIRAARGRFQDWLMARGIPSWPSQGNFVLFEARRPGELCSALKARGIYVRNRHAILPGCIRATIGGRGHVDRLLAGLEACREYL